VILTELDIYIAFTQEFSHTGFAASGCYRQNELETSPLMGQNAGRLEHSGQHGFDLTVPAAGEEADYGFFLIQVETSAGFLPTETGTDEINQWMSYESNLDIISLIEGDFKGENHRHTIHEPGDLLNPSLPPRPDLRANVIKNGYPFFFSDSGEPEIKKRIVDEDQEVKMGGLQCPLKASIGTNYSWQLVQYLCDSDHSHFRGIEGHLRTQGANARATDPGYSDVRIELKQLS
jgi:hypothetical protein